MNFRKALLLKMTNRRKYCRCYNRRPMFFMDEFAHMPIVPFEIKSHVMIAGFSTPYTRNIAWEFLNRVQQERLNNSFKPTQED